MIGKVNHPKHGTYFIFYHEGCYGMSKLVHVIPHCAYATLAALFTAKGI
jgi:hypothetical protein